MKSVAETVSKIMREAEWERRFNDSARRYKEKYNNEVLWEDTVSKIERIEKLENDVRYLKDRVRELEYRVGESAFDIQRRMEEKIDTATKGLIHLMSDEQLISFVRWCKGNGYSSWLGMAEKEKARRWCEEHSK